MSSIFTQPFATRTYPSPRTGQEITVNVAEIPLVDYPDSFVEDHFETAWSQGHHLLAADLRGTRPWSMAEIHHLGASSNRRVNEHPWQEIWEILTTDQVAILDLVMFTDFYNDKTMDRFEEFARLALPLIQFHAARIRRANLGGVHLELSRLNADEWTNFSEATMAFNEKHFKVEQPRKKTIRSWRRTNTLWFGYC